MAMILRLQREKGLLLMEKRQFQQAAEETMTYHQEQLLRLEDLLYRREQALQALSCEVQAYRHRLLSLGISPDFSRNRSEEEEEEENSEMGNLDRRLRGLEAERETMRQVVGSLQVDMALLRKIARRIGEEEEEQEASPSSATPPPAAAATTTTVKEAQHPPWCVGLLPGGSFPFLLKIRELVERTLSFVCSRKNADAGRRVEEHHMRSSSSSSLNFPVIESDPRLISSHRENRGCRRVTPGTPSGGAASSSSSSMGFLVLLLLLDSSSPRIRLQLLRRLSQMRRSS
ncbi:unnamed protein product [Spirodela intermedia]|uniref:GTD-binding domain-containing protein n=1 Tax=Spirodela intermedia TaxID=51605 RepID=A0A7I8IYN0_SPIIN|nr:unnamed protein product [Spirodela intermedia]CAA6662822.1 unnamed protein product [Spirodela intermedia]